MDDETVPDHNLQDELDDIRQIDQILHQDSDAEEQDGSDLETDDERQVEDESPHEQFSANKGFADDPRRWVEEKNGRDTYSDVDLDVSLEQLFLLNRQYQDLVVANLARVKEALQRNRELQEAKIVNKRKECSKLLRKFMPPYFKDSFDHSPPDNENTISIRQVGYPVPTDVQYPQQWSKQEIEQLQCGVKADGLERLMTPLLNQREVREKRLRTAVGTRDKQSARDEKKQIAEIDKKLGELKSYPLEELLGSVNREVDWQKVAMRHLDGTRTAEECRAQWQVAAHPSFKVTWTAAEQKKLKEIVKAHNQRDWNAIAAKLGTGHSAFECIQKYQQKLNSSLYRRQFTEEEDKEILELIEKYRVGNHIPWSKVSYFLKDRKAAQISWRWETKLDPSLRFGKWQTWEDELLTKLVQKQNGDVTWVKVAMELEGRSASQCRTRWLNSLDPELRRGRFSAAEDLILLEAAKKCGTGRWSKVAEEVKNHPKLAPGRNASMFMWRYRYLAQHFVDDERRSFNRRRQQEKMKVLVEEMTTVGGGCQTDVAALPQEDSYSDYLNKLDGSTFLDRLIQATKDKVNELGEDADRANVSELTGQTYWLPSGGPPTTKEGSQDEPSTQTCSEAEKKGTPLSRHKTAITYLKQQPGMVTSYPKDILLETQIMKELFPLKTLQPNLFLHRPHKSLIKLRRCQVLVPTFNKKKSLSWNTAVPILMWVTKVNFHLCKGAIHRDFKLQGVKFPDCAKRHHSITAQIQREQSKRRRVAAGGSSGSQGSVNRATNCNPYQLVLNSPSNPGVGEIVSGDMIGQLPVGPKTNSKNGNRPPAKSGSDRSSESLYVMKTNDGRILLVAASNSQPPKTHAPNLVPNQEKPEVVTAEDQGTASQQRVSKGGAVDSDVTAQSNSPQFPDKLLSLSTAWNNQSSLPGNDVTNLKASTNTKVGSGMIFQQKFKPYYSLKKPRGRGGRTAKNRCTATSRGTSSSEESWISQVVRPPKETLSEAASSTAKCSACANNRGPKSMFPARRGCQCSETVVVAEVSSDDIGTSYRPAKGQQGHVDGSVAQTLSNGVSSVVTVDSRSSSDIPPRRREKENPQNPEVGNKGTPKKKSMESMAQDEESGESPPSDTTRGCASGIHNDPTKDQQSKSCVPEHQTGGNETSQTFVQVPESTESEHSPSSDSVCDVPHHDDTHGSLSDADKEDPQKKSKGIEDVTADGITRKGNTSSERDPPISTGKEGHPSPDKTRRSTDDEAGEKMTDQVISCKAPSGSTGKEGRESHKNGTRGREGPDKVGAEQIEEVPDTRGREGPDKDGTEQIAEVPDAKAKGASKNVERPLPLVQRSTYTRARRKAAPKPGDFVISSSDDSDDDIIEVGRSCKRFKLSGKEDTHTTTDKSPVSLSTSSVSLPGIPPTPSSLAGLSPDTKVLIGPGGTILGILPAEMQSGNSTVFPAANQFMSVLQPHGKQNSASPSQVSQPLNCSGLPAQVAPVPITSSTTFNANLPRTFPLTSLPISSTSSSSHTTPLIVTKQQPAGTSALVQNSVTLSNQNPSGNLSTAVTPSLHPSNQVVQQLLKNNMSTSNQGNLNLIAAPSNSGVSSSQLNVNLLAPQALVIIPGGTTSANLCTQQLVNPGTNQFQTLSTPLTPNMTILTSPLNPQNQTNSLMPTLVQNPSIALGLPGGTVLLPNTTPTALGVHSNPVVQPSLNLNLPIIAPSPNVATQQIVTIPSTPVGSVQQTAKKIAPQESGGTRVEIRSSDGTSSGVAPPTSVNVKATMSRPIMSRTAAHDSTEGPPCRPSTPLTPIAPKAPGSQPLERVSVSFGDEDCNESNDGIFAAEAANSVQGGHSELKADTVRRMLESRKGVENKNKAKDSGAGKPSRQRQPCLPELLKEDQHTVNLDKLEEFSSCILGNKESRWSSPLLPPNLSTLFSFKHLLIKKASLEKTAERFSVSRRQLQNLLNDVGPNSSAYKEYHTVDLQDTISPKEFLVSVCKLPAYTLFQERFITYFLWPAFLSLLQVYPPRKTLVSQQVNRSTTDGRKRNGARPKSRRKGHGQLDSEDNVRNDHQSEESAETAERLANENASKKNSRKCGRPPKGRVIRVKLPVQPLRRGTRRTPLRKVLPTADQNIAHSGTAD